MKNTTFSFDNFNKALNESYWSTARFCFELSKELNEPISTQRVYNWLSGQNTPDKAMVFVIAKLFDRPISDFYEEKDNPK